MDEDPNFSVDVRHVGATAVVAPRGEVDLATVAALREALRTQEAHARVVLDLRNVEFIDSAGVGLVIEQLQRCEKDGFEFAIVRGPDQVHRLFRMVGLADRLLVLDDVPSVTRGPPGA